MASQVEAHDETLGPPTAGSATSGASAPRGRYVIRGEIGHGGMGAVLHGLDTTMDRDLAIKVLRAGLEADPEQVRRFYHEARVHGRLQHPGVVPIYEVGVLPEQGPYFTMKLVQGQTLAALLRGRADPRQDLPRFLQIFEQVCQTLAYAHSCGVLHRDLKPLNIMVGAFGEVQVMDWGLAKVLHVADAGPAQEAAPPAAPAGPAAAGDSDQTEAGAVLGTPAYMAPEQARGDVARVDERADVFGLGAILCEILTGRPPFAGRDMDALLQAAFAELADARARLDASGADPELIRLAEECLAEERDARPRDAGAVAKAMTAYLAGVQERLRGAEVERAAAQAKAAEARAKAAAERRARRLTVGLAAALLLLAVLAAGGWLWLEQRRATTTAAVNEAFVTAKLVHERAGGDLGQLGRAVAAMKEAQALAEGGYCDEDLRTQVQEALARVEAEEHQVLLRVERETKHQQMLDRLEKIRLHVTTAAMNKEAQSYPHAARAYEQAFRDWHLDVDRLREDEAVARIAAYPPPLVRALAGGLDRWVVTSLGTYVQGIGKDLTAGRLWNLVPLSGGRDQPNLVVLMGRCRQRLRVARRVDADPLRNQLRDAVLRYDAGAFKKLARQADAAKLPVDTVEIMAWILWGTGERDLALDLLRKASSARPEDYWTHMLLALFRYWQHVDDEDALRHFAAAVALRPGNGQTVSVLGECLLKRGKHDEAIDTLRRAVQLSPQWPHSHFFLGIALAEKGDLQGAIRHYREAVRLDPSWREHHHRLAGALRANKDVAGALAAYRAATKADPDDPESLWQAGQILRELGKPADALEPLQKAARLNPKSVPYALSLGDVLRELRKWDEALPVYQRIVKADPNSGAGHYGLGRVLREKGKADEALAEFAAAARLQPDLKDAHELLGQALEVKGGDVAAAVAAHREMHKRWPADAAASTRLAAALLRQAAMLRAKAAWEPAAASYRESLALRPDDPAAVSGLGEALFMLGRFPEAIPPLTRVTMLRPTDTVGWRRLAWSCLRAGQAPQAVAAFREAVQRGPALPDDHFGLGKSLLLVNDAAGAAAALREAVHLVPSRGDFQYALAVALRGARQLPEALAACRQAVRLMPRDAPARLLLGQALTDLRNAAEALPAFQEVMRLQPSHDVSLLISEALVAKGSVEAAITYLTDPVEPWTDQTAQAYCACLVLQGKTSEYRACCAALLKRYRRTRQEPEAFWIARCLALAPDAVSDPAEAVRLAERAQVAHPTCGWYLNALALAHLRAGQPEKAIGRAQDGLRFAPEWQPGLQWLVLALTHQRLGHADEARRWLDKAKQFPAAQLSGHVLDRVYYQCLRREAEAAVKEPAGAK
jgi:serine/threonine-protein kinase